MLFELSIPWWELALSGVAVSLTALAYLRMS